MKVNVVNFNKTIQKLFTIQKLLLILSVGLPGLSKLVLAILIKYIYGLESLGDYASDMNIALICGSVTGAGFSVIIMNRAPLLQKTGKDKELLGRIAVLSLIVAFLSLPILYSFLHFGIIENWQYVFWFVIGYSVYQIFKHYLLAFKDYTKVVIYEIISLLSVCIGILIFKRFNPLLIHSIVLITIFGGVTIRKARINISRLFVKREITSGLGFGFSNLSSTFLSLISVPLAKQFLGPMYAGFLGLINPAIQIIILIPRSFSSYYLPEIVKNKSKINEQKNIYSSFSKINLGFLVVAMIVLILFWFVYQFMVPTSDILLEYSNIILLVITINVFSSQVSLPLFTFLSAWDKSKLSFSINLIMLCYFLCFLPLIVKLDNTVCGFIIIYSLLIIGNLARYFYLKNKVLGFFFERI